MSYGQGDEKAYTTQKLPENVSDQLTNMSFERYGGPQIVPIKEDEPGLLIQDQSFERQMQILDANRPQTNQLIQSQFDL